MEIRGQIKLYSMTMNPALDELHPQLNIEALGLFWEFIDERQNIWHKRVVEGSDPPWTQDKVLRDNRFTNVYRELDPGTQYVIQNVLERDQQRRNKILNVMIYRLIGRSETHKRIGFQTIDEFNPKEFESDLKYRRDELGEPVFTGAYMVSGYNGMGSSDKIENVTSIFEKITDNDQFFDQLLSCKKPSDAYDTIREMPGFGDFLSYQVLVDLSYPLTYYDGKPLLSCPLDDWAVPGPGAKKGLKTLIPDIQRSEHLEVMRWLKNNQRDEFNRLDIDFTFLTDSYGNQVEISLSNIQNCLCEFYKYHKILTNEGRARRRFKPSEMRSPDQLRLIYKKSNQVQI